MGYLHIENLYKEQTILMFKECFALEKIHGSSAHLTFALTKGYGRILHYSPGEVSVERFKTLFDEDKILENFKALDFPIDQVVTVYGEVYGGKLQRMSDIYGPDIKFIAFDVKVGDCWLSVPNAEDVANKLGLEFVSYTKISTDLESLDKARNAESVQAIRNGMGPGKESEGVVLKPLIELTKNNGDRVIVKYKREKFRETSTTREIVDPKKVQVIQDAEAAANEWCVMMRLEHVLQKIPDHSLKDIPKIIQAMTEDIYREGSGEIVQSKELSKAIGAKTVFLYKEYLKIHKENK